MSEDLRQERSIVARPQEDRSILRLWIIPASLLFHMLLAAVFFVQWPSKQLNAAPEEVVSLELVPAPEEEDKASQEAEPSAEEQEAAKEEPPPPPPPSLQEPQPEPQQPEQAAQSNILPDIAIRPNVETQLDAQDKEEQSQPQQEASPQPPVEKALGFGDAQSVAGELPAGEVAPIPISKPEVAAEDAPLEERPPLSNEVIEQSGLRQILGDLPPRRRLNQICTIEAISQIRATSANYAAVRGVVPASDEGLKIDGGKMVARGGAFNLGNGRWVEIDFTCEADLNDYRVLRFSQKIGRELTEGEVRARGFDRFN